jgi:hypothetical protein
VDDKGAGSSEESGWGTPIQRLRLLAHRCFAEGLSPAEVAAYVSLEADVARTCGTTPAAVARLLLQRELARRSDARSAVAHRHRGGFDHRPVHLLRDLTDGSVD